MALRLPRYGVTAFCPTSVACTPPELRRMLRQVRLARRTSAPRAARVLPAHLESNFINPQFRGAQPLACLRSPSAALAGRIRLPHPIRDQDDRFAASDLLAEIERAASDVGIVTLAPELDGGLALIRWLTSRGHRVSLGHSGATYEQGLEAISAGACQATHLFNRMPPLDHRNPGLVGAVLGSEAVAAELICDGCHVHPALLRMAVAAKGPSRVLAVTDGTAVSGLRLGAWASLGGQAITAGESTARLRDGTTAGSLLTMDRAFQHLVHEVGLSVVDAATVCSTTPAREMGAMRLPISSCWTRSSPCRRPTSRANWSTRETAASPDAYNSDRMYSIVKRVDFCYGHRLLDYDGVCKHLHGHNAVAEIELQSRELDGRNMVCDFSEVRRSVKGWIDQVLDHRMVLRHDDPLVAPLRAEGEPVYLLDSNPTAERIARLIFDHTSEQGFPVVSVRVWETPTSCAEYRPPPAR
jgi:N-acetylglucosamine-6-phosphate deacetylase